MFGNFIAATYLLQKVHKRRNHTDPNASLAATHTTHTSTKIHPLAHIAQLRIA